MKFKTKLIYIIISILSKIAGSFENILINALQIVSRQPNGDEIIFSGLDLISFDSEVSIKCVFRKDRLDPYNIIHAILLGVFPTPNKYDHNMIGWENPDIRGTIPLDNIKFDKQIRKHLSEFEIKIDHNFRETVINCSKPRSYDDKTWITNELMNTLLDLHDMGFAHSIEAYQGDVLVGGLFGIIINGCYIGYSQFTTVSYSSKVAMYNLVHKLKSENFVLYDVMGTSEWLKQFGLNVLTRQEFRFRLMDALLHPVYYSLKIN